jgi:hypothetical protein
MVEGVLIICILQNVHQLKCDGVRLWREELGPRPFFDRTVLRRVIVAIMNILISWKRETFTSWDRFRLHRKYCLMRVEYVMQPD